MIDTIQLNLLDCSIGSHTPLTVEPSPYLHDTQQRFIDYDLFVDNSGEIVTGKKAYYNNENFNITILPKASLQNDERKKRFMYDTKIVDGQKVGTLQNLTIPEEKFNAGIFVHASLPGYGNKTNYQSLTIHEEKKILNKLEKDLSGIGIKCNIWDSVLSRVDSFQNIITDETFSSYVSLFSVMESSRMKKLTFADQTFTWRNGESQICIYDKIQDVRNKIKDQTQFGFLPANVMRIENRYTRKRKIFSKFKFTKLKDLYNNYDYLKEEFRNDIKTKIFKYDLPEIERLTGNFVKEDMLYFYNKGSRQWFSNYLKMCGVASLLKLSDIETIIEKMNEIIDSDETKNLKNKRMIKSRINKMLIDARFRFESSKLNRFVSTKTNRDLYNELQEKFYKQAA